MGSCSWDACAQGSVYPPSPISDLACACVCWHAGGDAGLTLSEEKGALPCAEVASGSSNRNCFCACGGTACAGGIAATVARKSLVLCRISAPSTAIAVAESSGRSLEAFLCGGDTSEAAEAPPGDGACAWSLDLVWDRSGGWGSR